MMTTSLGIKEIFYGIMGFDAIGLWLRLFSVNHKLLLYSATSSHKTHSVFRELLMSISPHLGID